MIEDLAEFLAYCFALFLTAAIVTGGSVLVLRLFGIV